ncbi:clostripain-related cysteine peptidase [Bacteroides sp. 51]|uniref:clostripain-related cysteine peptidase n=1 Tax=Bacteroides sp. 51 TaxID=2302938 RepID=UPI0013D8A632|nr:clostripain-related cysteine peptidase [Bacteroides sp. 51]NDV84903.1 hypothetical protein [Bacteroides sp. 51]
MKIKLQLLLWSLVLVLVSACSDNDDPKIPDPPAKGEERTVLALWVGQNDLSAYAISDFNEMVEGITNVDVTKNNLVVYCDTQQDAPQLIHISKSDGKVVADTIYTYNEQNSLKKEVMSDIISKVVAEFPAKSYGLTFASHADGWMESANAATRHLGDYNSTNMNITDLREVLESFPRFEFILLDACYMQAIEVAYELRNCADYIIGSPTEIPGPGAPYQKVVPQMFTTTNVAENIARAYYDYYGNGDGTIKADAKYTYEGVGKLWPYGVSVSVLKTSELNTLAKATENILSQYAGNRANINANSSSWFYYGYAKGKGGTTNYYDLDELIRRITGANEDYNEWRILFDGAQSYFETTKTNFAERINGYYSSMEGAEGLSVYIPQEGSSILNFYRNLEIYTEGKVWQSSGW